MPSPVMPAPAAPQPTSPGGQQAFGSGAPDMQRLMPIVQALMAQHGAAGGGKMGGYTTPGPMPMPQMPTY